MNSFQKKRLIIFISILLCTSIVLSIIVCVLISKKFENTKGHMESNYIDGNFNNITNGNYVEAIKYGSIEDKQRYNAEFSGEEIVKVSLPLGSKLLFDVGTELNQGDAFYSIDDQIVKTNCEMYITTIEQDVEGFIVTYIEGNKSYFIFSGDAILYYLYNIGTGVQIITGRYEYNVNIAEKYLIDGKAVFYTSKDNFYFVNESNITANVILKKRSGVLYISNDFLTDSLAEGQYKISLCNSFVGEQPLYYDKVITVEKFNEKYSIITSNNVQRYEFVLDNR